MAKKGYLFVCNRCGRVIDTENDLDCVETMMFSQRNIGERPEEDDAGREFHKVDSGSRLHFCGKCNDMLMSHYVYGYEVKKPPISEELVRCEDCVRRLRSDCPLCYIENQKLCFIDMRRDFFCGYGEKETENGRN